MNRKLFVITRRCGRLANRLVLFANFIALAEEQGHRVVNSTFHSYAELFETTRRDVFCRYPVANRRSWLDAIPGVAGAIRSTRIFHHAARVASGLTEHLPLFGKATVTLRESSGQEITSLDSPEVQNKIRDARIVFVNGWKFRAPDYVQRHAEKIRRYFRPIEEYERSSGQAVDRLRQNAGCCRWCSCSPWGLSQVERRQILLRAFAVRELDARTGGAVSRLQSVFPRVQ